MDALSCRGLAAEVCSLKDASDVYPLLGIIANVGLILGGGWIKTVNNTLSGAGAADAGGAPASSRCSSSAAGLSKWLKSKAHWARIQEATQNLQVVIHC